MSIQNSFQLSYRLTFVILNRLKLIRIPQWIAWFILILTTQIKNILLSKLRFFREWIVFNALGSSVVTRVSERLSANIPQVLGAISPFLREVSVAAELRGS